ncbi:hypothetical protein [Psychroserpens sp.]|uniref:hypothetical protein n=1 Tax=Psychroserpens sp. TaxID=2020870 RepID=UPI002B269E38|nr:hypothetical protein [Psychroserpens sp.]
MLNRFSTYLLYGNHFCGIEHTSSGEGEFIFVSVIKQSKKELNQEFNFELQSIKDVSEKFKKNQHAHLIINNEKVISKSLQSNQNEAQKLVYKSFPNINIEDFYFEVLSENNNHFISICRKDYVNTLIQKYLEHNTFITSISLGNNIFSTIKSFIKEQNVFTSNALIKLKEGQIITINKTIVENKYYEINGLRVSNTEILSFSASIQSILKNNATTTNFEIKHSVLLNEFKQTRFFSQYLKFTGLFILGMLLVNFLLFNHYFNEVNHLQQITAVNKSTKQKILILDESVSKKQKLADDLLRSNGSKSSFYVNTIMNSLPETILLSEYDYQPLLKRVKPDKPIVLDTKAIMVSGRSSDSELFSTWIARLEQIDWVKKVDIISYGLSSNHLPDFEIKITLSND